MLVLGCMSVLLLVEIARRAQSIRFAYHSATAGLVVLFSFVLVNTDAWIVRENVDRYAASGKLDAWYLASELSDDATPALVESVPRLHEPERSIIVACLRKKDEKRRHPDGAEWYSWNYRASRSAEAARAFRGNDVAGAGISTAEIRYRC
jgi:hypothetical protein